VFDIHTHVHDTAFDADREAVIERARVAGVERMLVIGTDLTESQRAVAHRNVCSVWVSVVFIHTDSMS
jgi:TatD DNase family protein